MANVHFSQIRPSCKNSKNGNEGLFIVPHHVFICPPLMQEALYKGLGVSPRSSLQHKLPDTHTYLQ